MTDAPPSPKRRHILSSINPDEPTTRRRRDRSRARSRSPRAPPPHVDDEGPQDGEDNTTRPRRTRLKLKDHKRHHRSRERPSDESSHRSSGRHHRHRRRHRSPTPPNPHEPPPLDSEAAFRESLFDAMADDEGASYWEGVYGQPVHVYSNDKVGATGELEQMTEEEYAKHVRQKMWEKTHAGLLEERAQRAERKKQKEEQDRHNRKLQKDVERSLRQGDERRQKKRWTRLWEEYTKAWTAWDGKPATVPWPLEEGQRTDINEKDVRAFFVQGLELEEIGEKAFVAKLKDERVRWHPDKMQQRLGGKVEGNVMKDVTAIFQIIDRLWTEMRPKA